MKLRQLAAAATFASLAFAVPAAYAADSVNPNEFVKQCDTDKDGMVSKTEAMKMVEKMFDKADSRKMGKLDKKQVEDFLKMLMMGSTTG